MEEKKETGKAGLGSGEMLFGILSYLWILCLVPVLAKREEGSVKFHARQGLMLFILEIGFGIIGIIPFLGPVIYTLGMLICGLLSLIGIVQVLMGNQWEMPVIGEWSKQLKV
ncbi:MAG: hypothetical protein ABIA77_02735 [Candidatus Omnitrophota bacterium]